MLQQYYEDDHLELYNLQMDTGERKNLTDVYPEKASEFKTLLDNWKKDVKAPVLSKLNPDYEPGRCLKNTLLEWNN